MLATFLSSPAAMFTSRLVTVISAAATAAVSVIHAKKNAAKRRMGFIFRPSLGVCLRFSFISS